MASPPSHVQTLLPDPSCLRLNSVEQQDGGQILITAAAVSIAACCPSCYQASHSIHSRYSRVLRDLPWQGSTVEFHLVFAAFGVEYGAAPASRSQKHYRWFLRSTAGKRVDCGRQSVWLAMC